MSRYPENYENVLVKYCEVEELAKMMYDADLELIKNLDVESTNLFVRPSCKLSDKLSSMSCVISCQYLSLSTQF